MSAAGDLIEKLKATADAQIGLATNIAAFLPASAYTGQSAIYQRQINEPQNVSLSTAPIPNLPTLPSFPTIPTDLDINYSEITTGVTTDITALQNSWMARFIPAVTDLTALDRMLATVTSGTAENAALAAQARLESITSTALATIKTETKTALDTTVNSMKATLLANFTASRARAASAISTARSSLAVTYAAALARIESAFSVALGRIGTSSDDARTRADSAYSLSTAASDTTFAAAEAKYLAAIALAENKTQDIAWTKARDQTAREAARTERETVSKWASRGFSMPGGVLLRQISRGQQATLDASIQIAAEQAVKIQQFFLDLAGKAIDVYLRRMDQQSQSNLRMLEVRSTGDLRRLESRAQADMGALTARTKSDTDLMGAQTQGDLRVLEVDASTEGSLSSTQAQTETGAFAAIAGNNQRFADMQVGVTQFDAKLAFDNLGLRLDFSKFAAGQAVQYRLGMANAINGLVSAYAALGRNETEYLGAIAGARRAAIQSIIDYYRAAIQYSEVSLKVSVANQEKDLKFAETSANFIATSVATGVRAAAASADVYSRTAGMALSGLNGVASVAEQLAG